MAALAAETAQPIPPTTGTGLRRPADKVKFFGNFSRFLRDKVIEGATKGSIPYLARSVLILNGRPPMSRI